MFLSKAHFHIIYISATLVFTYRGRESLFLFLLNSQLLAPPAFVHFDRVSGRNDNEVIRWDIAGLLSILDTKKNLMKSKINRWGRG